MFGRQATLLLVRHGQASIHAADYDVLSPLGAVQMEHLGRYWGTRRVPLARAFVGPLKRQRGSLASLRAGLAAAAAPALEATDDARLAEFQGFELMAAVMPELALTDPVVKGLVGAGGDDPRAYQEQLFRHVTTRWVRGELAAPGVQPFAEFRAQVDGALEGLVSATEPGATTVAVTSAGVIGAMVARVMGAPDERALELAWIIKNTAVTELLVGRDGPRLMGFNGVPHLDDPTLVTYR